MRRRTHLISGKDSGITILEIFLIIVLSGIIAMGAIAAHRKKVLANAEADCSARRWSWTPVLESIEWDLRRWEMLAPLCLSVGLAPLESAPEAQEATVKQIQFATPLRKVTSQTTLLAVAQSQEFGSGDLIYLCTHEKFYSAKINEIQIGSGGFAILGVDYSENPPTELPEAGAMVVSYKPMRYRSEPSENPPERILFDVKSISEKRPVLAGFENVFSQGRRLEDGNWLLTFGFALKECENKDDFSVYSALPTSPQGRWWIRKGDLVFEPWNLAKPEGQK